MAQSTKPKHTLFFSCPLTRQSMLSWLPSLMSDAPVRAFLVAVIDVSFFAPLSILNMSSCPFWLQPFLHRRVPRVFTYILNVCKYFLWRARNDFRFRGCAPSTEDVLESVKVRVRFNLPLFFKRFRSSRRRRYFVREWGARGVVASVCDNGLILHV